MGEDYVRPVTGAREPGPAWLPVLRFRLVAAALVLLLAYGAFHIWRTQLDPNRSQDPGIGSEDPGVGDALRNPGRIRTSPISNSPISNSSAR